MEKLPNAKDENTKEKFDFESDAIRSQTIQEEFSNLKNHIEAKVQGLQAELEKINFAPEENNVPLSSKQIRYFTSKANEKLEEVFSNLSKELKLKYSSFPISNRVLNVDYKKFKSAKKVKTCLGNITSVIEYVESENFIVFGGPGKILLLDSFSLEKINEIKLDENQLPVLFQYEPINEILYICCLNMTYVEAYKFDKKEKKLNKIYQLENHQAPGVASLKLIDKYLLTGGYDRKLTIWDIEKKKVLKDINFNEILVCFEQVSSVILLIGGQLNIIVFNVAENKVVNSYSIHKGPIWQLIYHSLYQLIISGSCDNTVKISSYKDDGIQLLHTFQQNNWSYGVCLLDQEHILTCSKDKYLRVYNVVDGTKVFENNEELEYDGDWISIDTKLKRIFLSETNGVIHIFEEKN